MILLLDNYDSFVHNLARYFRRLGAETQVVRSDRLTVAQCAALRPEAIVISPGPKRPEEAGCSIAVIRELGEQIPILGVCLGHQAIAIAYQGQVVRCQGMHGQASLIEHNSQGLFDSCAQPMSVGRYHSLAIDQASLPDCLQITARTIAGPDETAGPDEPSIIMGIQHRESPVYGVQFHPESVLTDEGQRVLANFVNLAAAWNARHHSARVAS